MWHISDINMLHLLMFAFKKFGHWRNNFINLFCWHESLWHLLSKHCDGILVIICDHSNLLHFRLFVEEGIRLFNVLYHYDIMYIEQCGLDAVRPNVPDDMYNVLSTCCEYQFYNKRNDIVVWTSACLIWKCQRKVLKFLKE